jgi:hypothetical protein
MDSFRVGNQIWEKEYNFLTRKFLFIGLCMSTSEINYTTTYTDLLQ